MTSEHEIRELAYYIWVSEGKPSGQSDKHWHLASKMVAEQKNKNTPTLMKTKGIRNLNSRIKHNYWRAILMTRRHGGLTESS
jgi:hypothetical protein